MKKLLIPLFSLLLAVFLNSCAHDEPVTTTTSTTTRETTVAPTSTTTQRTSTRY